MNIVGFYRSPQIKSLCFAFTLLSAPAYKAELIAAVQGLLFSGWMQADLKAAMGNVWVFL